MLHLLRLEYTRSEEEAEPCVSGHVAFLERHHQDGTFLLSGQAVPPAEGGAIIACGIDRAGVERLVAEDPFVRAGVAKYTVTTIQPACGRPPLVEFLAPDLSS